MTKSELPLLSNDRYLPSSLPSKNLLVLMASIKSVRNSRVGPPVSTASSVCPMSSVNLTKRLQVGSNEERLNPLRAPSQTLERFILNLLQLFVFMLNDRFDRMSAAVSPISVSLQHKKEKH